MIRRRRVRQIQRLRTMHLIVMTTVGLIGAAFSSSLVSSGAASAGSGMYSLSQNYYFLNLGIAETPVPCF